MKNKYDDFSTDATSGYRAGVNMPELTGDEGKAGVLPLSSTNLQNYYVVANFETGADANLNNSPYEDGAWNVATAYSIDVKMDDGIAINSNVNTYDGRMFTGTAGCRDTSGGSPYPYDIDNDVLCVMQMSMFTSLSMD